MSTHFKERREIRGVVRLIGVIPWRLARGAESMLPAIRAADAAKVAAFDAERSESPFSCPGCSREVVLHKGRIKVHHFKHKPPVFCGRGEGESEAHLRCKREVYQSLLLESRARNVELEKDLGAVQPDIYAEIDGFRVGIEVQRSALSVTTTARTQAYEHLGGVHVLWIAHFSERPVRAQHAPRAWERWAHAAYMGRVYYWMTGPSIFPVHFGLFMLHVEHRTWHESGGSENSAGGYDRRSKRYVTPMPGPISHLVRDFRPQRLAPFTGGTVFVPQRLVFLDGRAKWW